MGMFDELICHYPLPGYPKDRKSRIFQTKSLDCLMDLYTITEDGRLVCDEKHDEYVPEHERPYPNEKGIKGMIRSVRTVVDKKDVLVNYTGPICFYDWEPADPKKNKPVFSIEYFAYFDKGHLGAIIKSEEDWSENDGEHQVYLAYEREKLNKAIAKTAWIKTKQHL